MANYTILLIDYEPRSIESLSRPLQSAGYSIVTASDGIEGIEVFKRIRPDLVLIEAMIPKKHGFEVCQALRGTEHGEDVPIAILTAVYKGRKYRHQAIHNYKCNEYLEKPVGDDALVETVRRMLEGREPVRADSSTAEQGAPADTRPQAAGSRDVPPELAQTTEAEIMERLEAILPGLGGEDSGQLRIVQSEGPTESVEEIDEARIDAAFAALEGGAVTVEEHEEAEQVETTAEEPSNDPDPDSIESLPLATSEATPPEQETDDPDDEEPSAQVFSFDPDRARRRRAETGAPRPASGATAPPAQGSAAAQPLVVEPEESEREEARPLAEVTPTDATTAAEPPKTADRVERQESAPRTKPPTATRQAPRQKKKMPAWVWIVAALVLVGASAGAFLMLRGEPESVATTNDRPPVAPVAPVEDLTDGIATSEAVEGADAMVGTAEEPAETAPPAPIDLSSRGPAREPEPKTEPEEPRERVAATRPAKPTPEPTPPRPEPSEKRPEPVVETKPQPEAAPPAPPLAAKPEPEPQSFAPAVEARPATTEPEPDAEIEPAATPAEEPPVLEPEASLEPEPAPSEPVRAEPPPPPHKPVVRRGQLMDLGEVDVVPRVVHRVMPRYTLRAQKFRQEGTVELNVLVDDNGAVEEVVVVTEIPRSDLNDSAVKAVKAWTYAPATKDGVPVKVWKLERIEFKR